MIRRQYKPIPDGDNIKFGAFNFLKDGAIVISLVANVDGVSLLRTCDINDANNNYYWSDINTAVRAEEILQEHLTSLGIDLHAYVTNNSNFKEESVSWEAMYTFVQNNPGIKIMGYPFRNEWPVFYYTKGACIVYELILSDGRIVDGEVDASMQYMAEGLEWRSKGEGNISHQIVAAWRRKHPKEASL
jgi:hypothetical protein